MSARGEAHTPAHPSTPIAECARVIALATAAAMVIHALHSAADVLLEDGPRTEHGWYTSAVQTCDVLTALLFVFIAWRLFVFARLVARAPHPALRRLAGAAWIYAAMQGIVGVGSDIFRAMELDAAFKLTLNLGESGPSAVEYFLEPARLTWTIAHILSAALALWVALTLTRAAHKIDPIRPEPGAH